MDLGIPQNSRRLALLIEEIPSVVGRQQLRRKAAVAASWDELSLAPWVGAGRLLQPLPALSSSAND